MTFRARPFVILKQMFRLMAQQNRQYRIQFQVLHGPVLPLLQAFAWLHQGSWVSEGDDDPQTND